MDFRKLLDHLNTISEAGYNAGAGPYEPAGTFADDGTPKAPGENPEYDQFVAKMQAQGKKPHYDDFLSSKESSSYKELTKNVPQETSDKPDELDVIQKNAGLNKPDLDAAPKIDNTTMSGTSDKYSFSAKDVTGAAPATLGQQNAQQPGQLPPQVSNLRKQLNDLSTQLWQLNQQSIEGGKYEGFSNISKSLLESFNIFEADGLSMTGQRNKLVADINDVIKQLEPYKNNPDVAQDIARAMRGMQAPVKPAPLNITPEQPVSTGTSASSPVQKPSTQKPVAKPITKPAVAPDKNIQDLQTKLKAAGYDLGNFGPNKDGIDGIKGDKTTTAINLARKLGWDGKDINNIPTNTSGSSNQEKPSQPVNPVQPVSKKPGEYTIDDAKKYKAVGANGSEITDPNAVLSILNSPNAEKDYNLKIVGIGDKPTEPVKTTDVPDDLPPIPSKQNQPTTGTSNKAKKSEADLNAEAASLLKGL